MNKSQYVLSAITGVLLTLGLMLLPSILLGVPNLILNDRRFACFLLIIAFWVILESTGSNQVMIHNVQRQYRWLPYLMSITMLILFLASLTERALSETTPFTRPAIIGAVSMITGVLLRYLAIRTLGTYFLDDIVLVPGQVLVTTGIYSHLRHPSETGNLCIASGSALLLGSTIGGILFLALILPIVIIRIKLEDQLLMQHFPDTSSTYVHDVPALLPRWL